MKGKLAIAAAFFSLVTISGGAALHAYAAPLNFSTAESITLSSYPTTLTIATSSVADALITNTTSVLVTLSNTTGGNFTLLSPSYDLSVATSSGGGTVNISCSNGIETATLFQTTGSTIYTVTPTTQNCANASAPIITVLPTSTSITPNGVTITWTTNIPANSTVSYGTTPSYGATSTDATLVTSHSISLTGLSTSTLYHYAVTSLENGTSTTSGDYAFTTVASVSSTSTTPTMPSTPGIVVSAGGGGSAYNLSINTGVASTASANVTLSLYGTGAYMMELSNTPDFASSTWIPYATSIPWTLASNAGGQTVYVQYRSVSGSIIGSTQASINLSASAISTSTSSATSSSSSSAASSTGSTTGMTIAQLQNLLASLIAQLKALEAQAGSGNGTGTGNTFSSTSGFIFTRNLQVGITGNDVKQLQLYLIAKNAGSAAQKLKVHGMTLNFGALTKAALIEFQKKAGITPASGYFGSITRALVNAGK